MADPEKRKAEGGAGTTNDPKRAKTKKQWRVPQRQHTSHSKLPPKTPELTPGDKGIWATCTKGRERKCCRELLDLFEEYAGILYPETKPREDTQQGNPTAQASIEDEISRELDEIKKPAGNGGGKRLFEAIYPDMPCVIFFRCQYPINPQQLVHKIVQDSAANPSTKRTRFTLRLSPMSIIERASLEGLKRACEVAFPDAFYADGIGAKKFAIRPTFRQHNTLKRDAVIKTVADAVVKDGNRHGHSVDLTAFDSMILVEVYKNICGIGVVGSDFESLKRYNLTEIFDPVQKESKDQKESTASKEALESKVSTESKESDTVSAGV